MEVIFTIKPIWDIIARIREDIEKVLGIKGISKDIIEKANILCWELLENAVKYGIVTPDCPEVKISFAITANELIFYVSNGVKKDEKLEYLFELVKKLKETNDIEAMYIQRLKEITENPKVNTNLGIYRIFYETEFQLDYVLEGNKLTAIAKRLIRKEI